MTDAPRIDAKKSLGQNFLHDKFIIQKIVDAIRVNREDMPLMEIGPGTGALTKPLLESGATLLSLEKDHRMEDVLRPLEAEYPFTLQMGDALKDKYVDLTPAGSQLVGNLPYNIGTVIVTKALETPEHWERMVFMLQKEVVGRICANPGDKDWGRLALYCQLRADCKRLFDVPRGAFNPPPKITSSIVEIVPREKLRYECNVKRLEELSAMAFNQRRKMLRASLKSAFDNVEAALESVGIKPTDRPETISLELFCKLSLV